MTRTSLIMLLVGCVTLLLPVAGYAAATTAAQFNTNAAGTGTACAAGGLTVNREGITELVCDVAVTGLGADFTAGDVIVIQYSTNLDLTSPVLADGASVPVANLAGTGVTVSTATFNRTVTLIPVTTTIKFTITIASVTAGPAALAQVAVRNLRFNVSGFAAATAHGAFATQNGTLVAPGVVVVGTSTNTRGAGSVTGAGAGTQSSNSALSTQASASLTEGFAGALRAARAANTTTSDIATTATQATFNVTNIPSGVTVTFPSTFTASASTSGGTEGFQVTSATTPLTATGGALAVTYDTTRASTANNPLDVSTAGAAAANKIVVTVGTSSGFGTASIQVSFGPDSASTAIPRYAGGANTNSNASSGRGIIPTAAFFAIASVQTNAVCPWTFNTFGFESAYAVSNTGKDDLATGGASQATGQAGVVRVTVFANDGTTTSITTSSTVRPGRGLNADGTISPGGTWAFTLSDVLGTADKEGYLVIQSQFQFLHAVGFSIDPAGGFFSTPCVVLPSVAGRSSPEAQ